MNKNSQSTSILTNSLSAGFSAYLDTIRVLAALCVLAGHLEQDGIDMWWLPLRDYSHEAVIIFFVLSGFIIAHTTLSNDRPCKYYTISRVSRIFSVAIPAILFSLVASALASIILGSRVNELSNWVPINLFDVFSTFLFLNESWLNPATLTLNNPYWSLCYEVWYYIIFGIIIYTRSIRRILLLAVVCAITGPAVIALLPIWLLGVAISRFVGKVNFGRYLSWVIFIVSFFLIVLVSESGFDTGLRLLLHDKVDGYWMLGSSQRVFSDFLIGILVAANLLAFQGLGLAVEKLFAKLSRSIAYIAGFSFTLYLFHRPMTQLIGYKVNEVYINTSESMLIFCGIVCVCFAISYFTERRTAYWRRMLFKLHDQIISHIQK